MQIVSLIPLFVMLHQMFNGLQNQPTYSAFSLEGTMYLQYQQNISYFIKVYSKWFMLIMQNKYLVNEFHVHNTRKSKLWFKALNNFAIGRRPNDCI